MRKKTELQTQKHPRTSRAGAGKKGLIVKEENTPRSAGETCALDARSHRTAKLSGGWPKHYFTVHRCACGRTSAEAPC
jgi:hypothetical protein